jgi:pectinesterase inhibitor-like protein
MITIAAVFCLVAASAVAVPPATLQETCKSAGEQEALCVELLSSSPAAQKTPVDTRGLAHAAVMAAGANATSTAEQLDQLSDSEDMKTKSSDLQRCVEDCNHRYESAAQFLSQASSKLDAGSFDEASVLISGAQSVVKLCQRTCQSVPKGELTVCNKNVDRLCGIAASITRLLMKR